MTKTMPKKTDLEKFDVFLEIWDFICKLVFMVVVGFIVAVVVVSVHEDHLRGPLSDRHATLPVEVEALSPEEQVCR